MSLFSSILYHCRFFCHGEYFLRFSLPEGFFFYVVTTGSISTSTYYVRTQRIKSIKRLLIHLTSSYCPLPRFSLVQQAHRDIFLTSIYTYIYIFFQGSEITTRRFCAAIDQLYQFKRYSTPLEIFRFCPNGSCILVTFCKRAWIGLEEISWLPHELK